jgi:hypothetical protein
MRARLASTLPPSDPASGETPTMATERGRSSGRNAITCRSSVTFNQLSRR